MRRSRLWLRRKSACAPRPMSPCRRPWSQTTSQCWPPLPSACLSPTRQARGLGFDVDLMTAPLLLSCSWKHTAHAVRSLWCERLRSRTLAARTRDGHKRRQEGSAADGQTTAYPQAKKRARASAVLATADARAASGGAQPSVRFSPAALDIEAGSPPSEAVHLHNRGNAPAVFLLAPASVSSQFLTYRLCSVLTPGNSTCWQSSKCMSVG